MTGASWGTSATTDPATVRDTSRAAIANAAGASGVDFTYLLAQAKLESSLDPKAQAATSSARGLYQFTNATWMQTLQKHGNMLGMSGAALADPASRAQLMALRDDPHASAMMAAGLAGDNQVALTNALGRQPDASELYLAHFLGADGAGRFLTALAADPAQSAASINPKAAASNQSIFYDTSGQPRSLQQVMDLFRGRMASAMRDEGGVDPSAYINVANYTPVNGPLPPPDPATMGGPLARQFAAARDGNFAGAGVGAGTENAPTRLSMADTIQNAFGGADSASAPSAVRAAYGRLKSMGL
jgi:hypothetical protein